jgi:DNA-binding protein HU-beta
MNKTQLTDAVAERLGSKTAAKLAIDAVFETIADKVAAGETVQLIGFGTFQRVQRPARDARNPATGETIRVPATFVPKFKVGAGFRGQVRAGRAA